MHDLLFTDNQIRMDIRNTPHFGEVIIYDDAKPIFGITKSHPEQAPILRHESRNREKGIAYKLFDPDEIRTLDLLVRNPML